MNVASANHVAIKSILLAFSITVLCSYCFVSASENNISLRYCVDPDWMPYEGLKNGKHSGLSSNYLELISKYSDIEFQLIQSSSWRESLQMLKTGLCEATPFLNFSNERSLFLKFSNVYFESPNVLVSTKEQPFLQGFEHVGERSLAIPVGYRLAEFIKVNYPSIRILPVENERLGLEWVSNGKADLFVGSMLSVNSRILDNEIRNLKIAGWAGPEDKLRLGVIHSRADIIPLVNNAISRMTEKEHAQIYSNWNNIKIVDYTDHSILWKASVFVLVASVLFYLRHRAVKKFNHQLQVKNVELQRLKISLETTNQKLKFLSTHDPLTKLYNRNYFNSHVFGDLRADESQSVCLIVADIDHFKLINDSYGHSLGDEILKGFSEILSQTVREYDIVARWGGEEFVILCHQSRSIDAQALCERIAEHMSQHQFPKVSSVTASFGIAQLRADESIMQCFDRADKALYLAKENGRDQIRCA
ncbi:MAG: diguanylate cyclase [Kangiellaceae bacterium]|nr:diguanylate cyclase [Kangiellaceae bacterium]MCW8997388.1 diguanylate cyclase [Kangiellaceae bacterium]MCW9015945.1 diguanylate cyclase [Kangiellaceae bacterium]